MYWISNNGIELNITKKQAVSPAHFGPRYKDVLELSKIPVIRRQLDRITANSLVSFLSEYGAWDDEELAAHEENKLRLLWLACGDIDEEVMYEDFNDKT